MVVVVPLTHKATWLLLRAVDDRVAAETARYQREDPADDAEGDFGNDLHYLTLIRQQLAALQAADAWHDEVYECWHDPADSGITLTTKQNVAQHRTNGQLSEEATLLYTIVAATWEEAQAIHHLRQGWAPYMTMGEASTCPECAAHYYPMGSGTCWRCGFKS
jgi:hypothetical protein